MSPFEENSPVRVVVVDDHTGFRRALVASLSLVNNLEVVGEASNGEDGCETVLATKPDAVLMDMSMPGISGVDAMRRIHRREPDLPVIILTAHADDGLHREALAAGAAGFIAKGGGLWELVGSIHEVVQPQIAEQVGPA